jgi:hypothetical protein
MPETDPTIAELLAELGDVPFQARYDNLGHRTEVPPDPYYRGANLVPELEALLGY